LDETFLLSAKELPVENSTINNPNRTTSNCNFSRTQNIKISVDHTKRQQVYLK